MLDAIDDAGGRITFAQFMALALGHREHGYYSRADLAWGARGDYETSPEVHPIFGYLWARQVAECWERLDRPARRHGCAKPARRARSGTSRRRRAKP